MRFSHPCCSDICQDAFQPRLGAGRVLPGQEPDEVDLRMVIMKRRFTYSFAASLFVLLCFACASAQSKLLAGIGKSDITPPLGTPLAGYGARAGRPSTGVHDPTEARAIVIDNGSEKVAFVAVDHLGYDHAMVERIRSIASKATGIQPDRIFIMSSHTHSGGGAYLEIFPILAGKFDPRFAPSTKTGPPKLSYRRTGRSSPRASP